MKKKIEEQQSHAEEQEITMTFGESYSQRCLSYDDIKHLPKQ